MNFAVLTDHRGKIKETEKTDKYFGPCQRTKKKPQEYECDDYTNCS